MDYGAVLGQQVGSHFDQIWKERYTFGMNLVSLKHKSNFSMLFVLQKAYGNSMQIV